MAATALHQICWQSKCSLTFAFTAFVALLVFLVSVGLFSQLKTRLVGCEVRQFKAPHQPKSSSDSFITLLEAGLSNMTEKQLEDLYFAIVRQKQTECHKAKRIGGDMDGGWDVCFSKPFDISKSRSCLAFSFGVNGVYGYDDELADSYNCRVLMFDPSMTHVENHKRRRSSWFYKIGLAGGNTVTSNGWTMRTLCTLFSDFGANGTVVDILKVDIEIWEWESFERALQDGCLTRVKQLLFESHTDGMYHRQSDYRRYIRVWLGLFRLGFRTWKWHENPMSIYYPSNASGQTRACCYEHYLLNSAFA